MRKLAAGNWKMNGSSAELAQVRELLPVAQEACCEILLCPPATLIDRMRALIADGPLAVGGQDCHTAASGAHTGDVSAYMLADAGATFAIVGHSERRADHGEDDATVKAKAEAAIAGGLTAIVCVGETLAERDAGATIDVVGRQLAGSLPEGATAANTVIAYEPVWAIGTGRVATSEQVGEVHGFLRTDLAARMGDADAVRLLYGGSVKPDNAGEIFAVENVDGALVGGASLKAGDFAEIIRALDAA